jgi:hypothetical protein
MKPTAIASVSAVCIALIMGVTPAFAQENPSASPAQNTPKEAAPPTTEENAVVVEPDVPEEPPRFRLLIGPDIGYYLPSEDKTRRAFGDKFFSIGFGIGAVESVSEKGRVAADFSIISNTNAESRVLLIPIGVSYARALSSPQNSLVPYAGASLNFIVANLRTSRQDFEVKSGYRSGVGASAFVGLNISRNGFLRARYFVTSEFSGFNLSGLSVSAGYRFGL